MNRYLYTLFIAIILSANSTFAVEQLPISLEELEDSRYFKPANTIIEPTNKKTGSSFDDSFDDLGSSSNDEVPLNDKIDPLFKQVRVHLTNKYRNWEHTKEINNSVNKKDFFLNNLKLKKKKENVKQNNKDLDTEESSLILDYIKKETMVDLNIEDSISLNTGITEHVTQKEMILDAKQLKVDEESGDMIALGRPVLYLPPQNTKIIADKFTHNYYSSIITGEGNVIIIRDGVPTKADFVEIDRNEETIKADNISTITNSAILSAKQAIDKDSAITLYDGYLNSEESNIYRFSTRMIGPKINNLIVDNEDKYLFWENSNFHQLHIDVDTILLDSHKYYDKLTAKQIKLSYKDRKIFKIPSFTAYVSKDHRNFEANYPEFGSRSKLGMFIGPGIAFPGPFGSVMKVVPFLNYQKKFGFGGALKYKTIYNQTELGYGTSSSIFFLRGQQRLDDNLYLHYGINSYMDEWFLGRRMPKYSAEIYYDKTHKVPDFLAKDLPLSFRHRLGFGIMQNNDENAYGEHVKASDLTTTRLRYMAEIRQSLYHYENNDFILDFSGIMQGSVALYGTGNTQIIGRIGPHLHTQYKYWMQDLGYYQAAYEDDTPMKRYDRYRYGHSTLTVSEVLRLHKLLTVGWSGIFNLSGDAPSGRLLQENRFIIAIGPDDIRVKIGYDFIRQTTYVGFDLAFDTKGTDVKYNKMVIKNPELLNQKVKDKETLISYKPSKMAEEEKYTLPSWFKPKNKVKNLEYAQVEDIEDYDKETIE